MGSSYGDFQINILGRKHNIVQPQNAFTSYFPFHCTTKWILLSINPTCVSAFPKMSQFAVNHKSAIPCSPILQTQIRFCKIPQITSCFVCDTFQLELRVQTGHDGDLLQALLRCQNVMRPSEFFRQNLVGGCKLLMFQNWTDFRLTEFLCMLHGKKF